MENKSEIINFCKLVKNGFGTITDMSVKSEYDRIYETVIDSKKLGKLLATLEKNELLDKKNSTNKIDNFYQVMYKKMKIE